MTVAHLVELVRSQSRTCRRLGSPFYGALLEMVADDVQADGPTASVLAGHEEDSGPSAVALRLMGTVHRLVLAGRAPELAAHYPSTGGDGDPTAAWPALRRLLQSDPLEIAAGLVDAPQTNEVGRAAVLIGALAVLTETDPKPVRLWEIGCSGGLNLRADHFRYRSADGAVWGLMSPVELDPAWTNRPSGERVPVHIVERVGGDVAPIDATTEDGAIRLTSYIWPDQSARLRRLRSALLVAREYPARLVRASAADLLAALHPQDGALTVVWHSVMWQYLTPGEQRRVTARIEEIGATATESAPVAHVAFEPRRLVPGGRHRFVVTVRTWPGGGERILGEAPPHGVPVTWGQPAADALAAG